MDMGEMLEELTPHQALKIVRRLSERSKEIQDALLKEMKNVLEDIDLNEVADEVFFVLESLDVQDLWDRSGANRDGYRSPDEVGFDMIEEELESFAEQVRSYLKLGMTDHAQNYCMGALLGIYRFDQESSSEFKKWTEDIPQECFGDLLDEWKKNEDNSARISDMDKFIKSSCPKYSR